MEAGDEDGSDEPARKRVKYDNSTSSKPLASLGTRISPPRSLRQGDSVQPTPDNGSKEPQLLSSPFHLTKVQDLPEALNKDTITLEDIIRDPLIGELWSFNYLTDVDFLMNALDPDTKDLTDVHIVHGFWKREDGAHLKEQAAKYRNLTLHTAYMPEMCGTHHTKMMILIRHDEQAQIVIHTANMIPQDWGNLTQAVWKSPLLPAQIPDPTSTQQEAPLGSGAKFKMDFLNYLRAYDINDRKFCKPLVEKLQKFDFSPIRGTLIGSVPGRHPTQGNAGNGQTIWGWPALRKALREIPVRRSSTAPEIVLQVSSIASLGPTSKWLDETLFASLDVSKSSQSSKPKHKIIFPTADEVRRSLYGYFSGHSIHIKIQTAAQQKQLQYLKPMLHHWAGDGTQHTPASTTNIRDAGRRRAAPHIKTYIRFSNPENDEKDKRIDWALVTSANLSKQAWGEAANSEGKVRISSYELGVLVWPELFGPGTIMVPVFKQNMPSSEEAKAETSIVGLRMPYDLPLVRYAAADEPWCATASYEQPDWTGQTWNTGEI